MLEIHSNCIVHGEHSGQISHGMAKIRITGRGYSSTHSVEGRNAKRRQIDAHGSSLHVTNTSHTKQI